MSLSDLHTRLLALAAHDPDRRVFGATGHRWVHAPVEEAELAAFEAVNGPLPPAWRAWLVLHGTGAGPFYGVRPLPAEVPPGEPAPPDAAASPEGALPGCLPLTDQGCGYEDVLVLRGPHRGEVWVDMRAAEGPVAPWYPSVEAWLEAWVGWAEAAWALRHAGGPRAADPAFVARVRAAIHHALHPGDDPLHARYPHAPAALHTAEAHLHLAAGELDAALVAFEAAGACSPDGGAGALGRALVAEARGDATGRLAAAEAGLSAAGVWGGTEAALHRHRIAALEALERWPEALAARVAHCDRAHGDADAWLTLAWIHCARGEVAEAVARIRGLAADEVEPEEVAERAIDHGAGMAAALREQGSPEVADALEAALRAP